MVTLVEGMRAEALNRKMKKTAIIIGAGPAGLTAAYELLTRSAIVPIVLEQSSYMGGISRTVEYKGNRIDIGGHRFFSKSDRVMNWWLQHMPLADVSMADQSTDGQPADGSPRDTTSTADGPAEQTIHYRNQRRSLAADAPRGKGGETMLIRERRSRIYFLRKFFDYPIQLSAQTLRNLGLVRVIRIGFSYVWNALFPPSRIENLEQFFISRFGGELYRTFFRSYTEKVWGVPCDQISAEWGAQRIKGLSITKSIAHHFRKLFQSKQDLRQKEIETSLIEQFMYPRLGPGQLWEIVARKVQELGGVIHTGFKVDSVQVDGNRLFSVSGSGIDGVECSFEGDYFFSTMPIQELVQSLSEPVPSQILEISDGLQYRDFVTVGLLVKKLAVHDSAHPGSLIQDNWIYIQEPEVRAGRLQIFNNWSPYLVRDPSTVWIGVEYFCYQTDDLWTMPEEEMAALARHELAAIGIIDEADVLDSTVLRMPKTYPAYFGTYDRFDILRDYLLQYQNLFMVGRNGMHKYNNQDHSMLTAMTAVDNILAGRLDQSNIWAVNTEMEYHEERAEAETATPERQHAT
jgi:protoporphyrinogen oxidase